MTDFLFDRDEIMAALSAVAEILDTNSADLQTLVMVGGSYLTVNGWRDEGTRDIDNVTYLSDAIRDAAAEVGRTRGYEPGWLNDHAVPFGPQELPVDQCSVLLCS
jgi:hypothetical protein